MEENKKNITKAGVVFSVITIALLLIGITINMVNALWSLYGVPHVSGGFIELGWLLTVAFFFIGWMPCVLNTVLLYKGSKRCKMMIAVVWILYVILLFTGIFNPIPQSV